MKEDHDTILAKGAMRACPTIVATNGHLAPWTEHHLRHLPHDAERLCSRSHTHLVAGLSTDEVLQAYEQTKEIFDRVLASLAVGQPCKDSQIMVCEYYESKGHKTPLNTPGTEEGYVHSLGHGIGLDVHEEPRLSHAAGNTTLLQPGHVVSVEPGLYYPDRGFGVRIEDSVAFNEAGVLVNLSDYPYDLIVPMKK